jgi:hypothetical protein
MAKLRSKQAFREIQAQFTQQQKIARQSPLANSEQEKLSWQVSLVDYEGDWGWQSIDANTLKFIIDKLAQFETMKWAEVLSTGSHPLQVKHLCAAAQQRLQELHVEDEDELFSLRLSAKQRLWGIRDRHLYKILWYDPNHTVYPVEKKHT